MLEGRDDQNRFNGFFVVWKTVETVRAFIRLAITQLKQGVNEASLERSRKACEISDLGRLLLYRPTQGNHFASLELVVPWESLPRWQRRLGAYSNLKLI